MSLTTTTEEPDVAPLLPVEPVYAEVAQPATDGRLRWLTQPVNLFLLLCALLPVVYVVSFISDRGVDMPVMDDWENAAIIAVKTADGTLTLPDLFRQYVSHRMVFTNLYTAITTVLAQWPVKFTMYFIVFQGLVCLAMLGALFAKDAPRAVPVVLVAFSVLMFSVRQNINWLLSTQTSWFFMLIFFLSATLVLRFMRPGWRAVISAGFLCACGVFSTLHGFAALPVLAVFMLMQGYRKPKYFIFWGVLTVALIAAFFIGYNFNRGTPQDLPGLLSHDFYRVPLYLFTYLGNPFVVIDGNLWPLAATIGVTGVLLIIVNAAFLYRRLGSVRPIAAWVTVGMWAVASGLLTSFGRGHYFPEPNPRHPLFDRYVLPSSFLWFAVIALVVLALRTISQQHRGRFDSVLTTVNVGIMVGLMCLFGWTTLWSYQLPPFVTETQLTCMQRFPATRNIGCMTRGLLDTLSQDELLGGLNGMAIHQLSGFRDIAPAYSDIISLYAAPRDTQRERNGTRFAFFEFENGAVRPVFHQPAESVSTFTLDIPDTAQRIVFFSAVHVDMPESISGPEPDGVIFRVAVRDTAGATHVLTEIVYDPRADDELKRVWLPLNNYRGQTVDLILQADDRENPNADYAMWVDPGVMVLTAEQVGE